MMPYAAVKKINGAAAFRALLLQQNDAVFWTEKPLAGVEVVVVPPGIDEPDQPAVPSDTVPTAVTIQQVGYREDPEIPLATVLLEVIAYAPLQNDADNLMMRVMGLLAPDGIPANNVVIADRWFMLWALDGGGGADELEEEPEWPFTAKTYEAVFDSLRGA